MPFLKYSAIPYALSVLMIFMAPFEQGSVANAIWVGFFLIAYYTAYTFFFIPRNALIPEVIPDAKDRVTYYGISTAFFMGSSSFMYTAPLIVSLIKKLNFDALTSWRIIFTLFATIGLACVLLGATAFKEKDYVKESVKPKESLLLSASTIFKNKSFITFFAADLFSYISMAFFQTAMLYYITMLLNIPEKQSSLVMLSAIGVALCLFPMIVKFSKKYGKKTMLVIASVVFTIVFAFIFFADKLSALVAGYELFLGLGMGIVVSFPFAAINILPQSCMSDIVQKDSIENEVNREGFFSATKTFIEKIAYSLAMVVVSSMLAVGAPEGQTVGVLGVKLTGIFAGLFSLISLIFFIIYDEKSVTEFVNKHREETKEQ
jgi:GPH family glycoside/pentoside/hexuronide:cation symporter